MDKGLVTLKMSEIKFFKIIFLIVALLLLSFLFFIPMINHGISHNLEHQLLNHPIPEHSIVLESSSSSGRFIGNGNGIQYLAVILIETELYKQDLENYYSEYSVTNIKSSDFDDLGFNNTKIFSKNYSKDKENKLFAIYVLKASTNAFYDFDVNGH